MRHAAGALAALLVATLAACAAGAPQAPVSARHAVATIPSLEGTRWIAADPGGDVRIAARLEFTAEGRVNGFTGCNRLSGSYRLEGDRLEVLAATTKRGCLGPAGDMEAKLLAVLADRPRVRLDARELVLTGASGQRFAFVPAPPTA